MCEDMICESYYSVNYENAKLAETYCNNSRSKLLDIASGYTRESGFMLAKVRARH
jgi:hypothetical protein